MYTPHNKRAPSQKPQQPQEPIPPRRDWLDKTTLGTAIVGVIVVVVATTLTQCGQAETDAKVAKLIEATGKLATSARQQADDTAKLRIATEDFARAMDTQARNTASLVDQAKEAAGYSRKSAASAAGQLETMRAETRPILSARTEQPAFDTQGLTDGLGRISWNVYYTNVGKTPATVLDAKVFFSTKGRQFFCVRNCKGMADIVLNPGDTNFTTGWSSERMTKAEFDSLLKMDNAIITYHQIAYQDAELRPFRLIACYSRQSNGSIGDCGGVYDDHNFK